MTKSSEILLPGTGILATLDLSSIDKEGQGIVFEYENRLGKTSKGFAMKWKDGFVAFQNRCPHWSLPLGVDGDFLDSSGAFIFCPTHGATFSPEDGDCKTGPCVGAQLQQFDIRPTEEEGHFEILFMKKEILSTK